MKKQECESFQNSQRQCSCQVLHNFFFASQTRSKKTCIQLKHAHEVSNQVCRPFIQTAYLDCCSDKDGNKLSIIESLYYTLLSWHNETINIYSHLVPTILIPIICALYWNYAEQYSTMMKLVVLTILVGFGCSTLFHISVCTLPHMYQFFLCVDLFGIFTMILGFMISGFMFGFECHLFWQQFYTIFYLSIVIVGLVPTWFFSLRIKSVFLRKLSLFIFTISLSIPTFHFFISASPKVFENMWQALVSLISFATIGFLFFNLRIPERWFPKTFDIIGYSHQWWHLFAVIGALSYCYWLDRTIEKRIEYGNSLCT